MLGRTVILSSVSGAINSTRTSGVHHGIGLSGFNPARQLRHGVLTARYNSSHSHSHSNSPGASCNGDHSHSHDDMPEKTVHHYYEYTPSSGTVKTSTYRDGKKVVEAGDDLVPAKKAGGHHHAHSHPEYPEMDQMDLSGEDFTIMVNPKKKNLWTKTKDFFNPHTPLAEMMGSSHSADGSLSGGHSHSHANDPEALKLYDPKNLTNEGVKITWIGFGVNCSMAITKFIGGFYFHSQALIADAVHAVGDLISDVLTLSTVKYTNKKADSLYPYGYGKIETFGSFMVSFILLYAGFQIGFSSFYEIVAPIIPNALHDLFAMIPVHSHNHVDLNDIVNSANDVHDHVHEGSNGTHAEVANINAAWLALGSIAVKEWLFRITRNVGERLNSKVLIANAWHHRVDSLTSVVAVATISTGYLFNIYWLDSIGGLIVSTLIMKVGISGVVQSFKELIDKAIPTSDQRYAKIEDSINVILMKKDSHVLIKDLSILPSGTNLNIVLKLGVSPFDRAYENKLTLEKMGSIGDFLKLELAKEFHNIKHTSIQFVSTDDSKGDGTDADESSNSQPEPHSLSQDAKADANQSK